MASSERSEHAVNSSLNPKPSPKNFGMSSKSWSLDAPRWAWRKIDAPWDKPKFELQDQVGQLKNLAFSKSCIPFNTGAVRKAQSHPNPASKIPPVPILSQNPKKINRCKSKGKNRKWPNSLPIGRSWILIDLANFRCRNKTFHRIEFYDLFRTIQTHHKLISKHNFITSSVIDVSENSDPSMTKSEKPKLFTQPPKSRIFANFANFGGR